MEAADGDPGLRPGALPYRDPHHQAGDRDVLQGDSWCRSLQARKLKPPPLAQVSDRIEEVLLEQHVNVLLEDYLRSLKDAGSV